MYACYKTFRKQKLKGMIKVSRSSGVFFLDTISEMSALHCAMSFSTFVSRVMQRRKTLLGSWLA